MLDAAVAPAKFGDLQATHLGSGLASTAVQTTLDSIETVHLTADDHWLQGR